MITNDFSEIQKILQPLFDNHLMNDLYGKRKDNWRQYCYEDHRYLDSNRFL